MRWRSQNFEKSYAYLSAQELDADYSGVCYSGSGVAGGGSQMPDHYTKTNAFTSYNEEWDFTKFPNDVVLINLGTNDANYVNADREPRKDEFVFEYASFLRTVRQKNPDSYILCTLGTLNPKDMYPLVVDAVKLFGGERISVFESPVQDMNDGLGADWHPSKITHEKLSKLVAEKIAEVLK